jgi:2,3-bisphosphoglycerate-dependent phosphoglycerate mutase
MTSVYFVRHAEPDIECKEDRIRPLTAAGLEDSKEVTRILKDKNIHYLMSSPYKRSMDTIRNLADTLHMEIHTDEDFRERHAGKWLYDGFLEFIRNQWEDFQYRISDGENLSEVQSRNMKALQKVLEEHKDENIVIATHGTALGSILNFYDPSFGYEDFMRILSFMPYIVRLDFENGTCVAKVEELIIDKGNE